MSITSGSQGIVPFLWYDGRAEEAMRFYTSVFPNSEILKMSKWGPGTPFPADSVMMGSISINGLKMHMFDAGPMFKFTEATSFFITCQDQKEVDYYWDRLTADGGEESMCGWLKDKFGLSWQIVPAFIEEKFVEGDTVRIGQMFQALGNMRKLDIAILLDAYNA
jgi:predicted 3-demethylubiquinone-9 3-methyltransferase (glyoxalase superfamily)